MKDSIKQVAVVALAGGLVMGLASPSQAGAASGVYINALCPVGQPVVGLYYKTDYGQAGFARWNTSYDGRSTTGRFSFGVSQTITNVSLSLGCSGTQTSWGRTYSAAIAVHKTPTQSFRVECTANGRCTAY